MTLDRVRKRPSYFRLPWNQFGKIVLVFIVIALFFWLTEHIKQVEEFPIHQVKIYGVNHLDVKETKQLLIPFVKKGFFSVSVDLIKDQLLQMPWVADASVKRIWPDQVIIAISEKKPIARWNEDSLISSTGEIFTPRTPLPENLPLFVGPQGQQITMLSFYSKLNTLLSPLHLSVKRLALNPSLSWNVEFANGIKMRLGYKDVLTRVNHFVKVYPKIVGDHAADVDYVDLRYPNGLAVRWKIVS